MPPTFDARTGTVYAGTGNPSPALTRDRRRGCIPWASGLVALDARSGRVRWGVSEVCGDVWDYDGGQPPLLYNRDGRRVVAHANKSGVYALRDARTGRPVAPPQRLLEQTRPRPTRRGVRVCPGALGGVPYSPAAYSPAASALFQPLVRLCMTYRLGTRAPARPRVELGGGSAVVERGSRATGAFAAIDARTGRIRWRRAMPAPMVGGALATAGGLVFSGSDDGILYAFDARTGATVWRGRIGVAFGSAPLTYRIGGVQYLAAVAGGSSVATLTGARVGGRLVVLRLDGRRLARR